LVTRNISRPLIAPRFFHVSATEYNAAPLTQEQPSLNEVPILTKFQELVDHQLVHPTVVRNITLGMGHHTMTEVQKLTIREIMKGGDV
jgi:ATP-dependent RNA helicase MSS116